jgi:hypothetical protein
MRPRSLDKSSPVILIESLVICARRSHIQDNGVFHQDRELLELQNDGYLLQNEFCLKY